jgi:hypothetical protein
LILLTVHVLGLKVDVFVVDVLKVDRLEVVQMGRPGQTRPHSPKAIFDKNVIRLDTFARVIRHFREFGASGHCLGRTQFLFLCSQFRFIFWQKFFL